jgi:hypothetical protein
VSRHPDLSAVSICAFPKPRYARLNASPSKVSAIVNHGQDLRESSSYLDQLCIHDRSHLAQPCQFAHGAPLSGPTCLEKDLLMWLPVCAGEVQQLRDQGRLWHDVGWQSTCKSLTTASPASILHSVSGRPFEKWSVSQPASLLPSPELCAVKSLS